MTDRSRPPPILRKGSTRTVLVIGPLALKLGLGERGRRCNRFEACLYRRANARRRAMLCPVLWCNPSGTVLAMRAARPLSETEKVRLMATRGFPDWDYAIACVPMSIRPFGLRLLISRRVACLIAEASGKLLLWQRCLRRVTDRALAPFRPRHAATLLSTGPRQQNVRAATAAGRERAVRVQGVRLGLARWSPCSTRLFITRAF